MVKKAALIAINDVSQDDYCLISYKKFSENPNKKIVKLSCNHCFFLENIIESYKITNKSGKNYLGKRLCPYCLGDGGYLPLMDDQIPIKGIHSEKKMRSKYLSCSAIIKSGKFKGLKCGCTAKKDLYRIKNVDIFTKTESDTNIALQVKHKFKIKEYFCGKHKKYADSQLFKK